MTEIEHRLQLKGVNPTSTRILVLRTLMECRKPMSLADLEGKTRTIDRSSIFRAVTLFLEHHLIHAFEDGSGSTKYELCPDDHDCHVGDMHAHFYCEHCKQTFCLSSVNESDLRLPDGFLAQSVNFVVKGLCPKCARHAMAEE